MSAETLEIPTLKQRYHEQIIPALKTRLGIDNIMRIPTLEKIVINMGVGGATQNKKLLDEAVYTLTQISGQKPVITKARKAISNFKLRKGMPIGCKVTLRRYQMWEFLDRLIAVTIPRIRDFRGLPRKSFDGQGNYTFGIPEQIVFLEVDRDKISQITGMDITMCTSADSDEEARALLEELGMPFRKT